MSRYNEERRLMCILSENLHETPDSKTTCNPIALVPYSQYIEYEFLKKRLERYYAARIEEDFAGYGHVNEDYDHQFSIVEFATKCVKFKPVESRFCREFNCAFVEDVEDASVKLIWIYLNGLDNVQGFNERVLSYWLQDYAYSDNLKTCHEAYKDRIVDTLFFLISDITVVSPPTAGTGSRSDEEALHYVLMNK